MIQHSLDVKLDAIPPPSKDSYNEDSPVTPKQDVDVVLQSDSDNADNAIPGAAGPFRLYKRRWIGVFALVRSVPVHGNSPHEQMSSLFWKWSPA